MRMLIQRLGTVCFTTILASVILVISSAPAHAQFPAYGGGGIGIAYPGWGYGGFYGYPAMGYGYGGMGYGYGYPVMGGGFYGGYGYPAYAYGGPGFRYYGFGYVNPGFYTPGLMNPLFGVGMSPLGVQSYMYETQVLGRRSRR